MNLHAAGLDIGSEELWACVPEDRDAEPVRPFGTLTPDLDGLADWLTACRMETVALASTGGYWLPVYALLEARGFRVSLVNAHHRKPVPGRKRDVTDCPGMQDLHTGGLLSGSCRPAAEMGAVQAHWRHRATWLEQRAAPIQHRQKALHRMHVQLTQVRTDMTGTPGLAISRAIVAGARAPVQLARCRDPRCAHSTAESAKALTGHERAEPVFALKPALALDDIYTLQVREGEAENERQFQASTPGWADQLPPLDREPTAASPSLLPQLTGVD